MSQKTTQHLKENFYKQSADSFLNFFDIDNIEYLKYLKKPAMQIFRIDITIIVPTFEVFKMSNN